MTSRQQKTDPVQTAARAAAFLAGQEITTTGCRRCGTEVSGIKGRYACPLCGWTSPWNEGHGDLPIAEDDPDWPGRSQPPTT